LFFGFLPLWRSSLYFSCKVWSVPFLIFGVCWQECVKLGFGLIFSMGFIDWGEFLWIFYGFLLFGVFFVGFC
jgi:hypothetical protein